MRVGGCSSTSSGVRAVNGVEAESLVLKHWSECVEETLVSAGNDCDAISVLGGAENGLFCWIGDVEQRKSELTYHMGELQSDYIVLEVQGQKIPGYTLSDCLEWIKLVMKNNNPAMFKTVPRGLLTRDLQEFLNTRFQKGSVDHELQQTIRTNIYRRTVPCTTRSAREGEVDGVDYRFLTVDQFLELEKSGALLESGVYDNNHYGTPKPPHSPPPSALGLFRPSMGTSGPSPEGSRQMGGSRVGGGPVPHPGNGTEDTVRRRQKSLERAHSRNGRTKLNDRLEVEDGDTTDGSRSGPLVNGVKTKTTPHLTPAEELPYGWERVEDPKYGVYYIDHINKRTQYENPVHSGLAKTSGRGDGKSLDSPRSDIQSDASSGDRKMTNGIKPAGEVLPFFTRNPTELDGSFVTTTLIKSARGLGFTIVGGDGEREEFLQIKSIAANGPAHIDGKLRRSDVLVYVNGKCVLGYTHQDIISLFQSITVGDRVTLEICRGYSLPFDPDDPNNEVVTTVAVTLPSSMPNIPLSQNSSINSRHGKPSARPPSVLHEDNRLTGGYLETDGESQIEIVRVPIVKGQMGFGFTIAESPHGQRIRQIMDRARCGVLMEGDLLVEINGVVVKNMAHAGMVAALKACPIGEESIIVVQRGGLPMKGKPRKTPSPMPSSGSQSEGRYEINPVTNKQNYFPALDELNFTVRQNDPSSGAVSRHGKASFSEFDRRGDQPRPPVHSRSRTPGPEMMRTSGPDSEPITRGLASRSKTPTADMRILPPSKPISGTPDFIPASQYRVGPAVQPKTSPIYQQGVKQVSPPYSSDSNAPQDKYGRGVYDALMGGGYVGVQSSPESGGRHHSPVIMPGRGGGVYSSGRGVANHRALQGMLGRSMTPLVGMGGGGGANVQTDRYHESPYWVNPARSPGTMPTGPLQHSPGSRPPVEEYELTVSLRKQEGGFGFRIIGGTEEGSQVSVGHVVPGGAADLEGSLRAGDEILNVDGVSVIGASHRHVVQLMGEASTVGHVTLRLRRRGLPNSYQPIESLPSCGLGGARSVNNNPYPYDVTLHRRENEGFGFVIISSVSKSGSVIGKIIEGSPADRSTVLRVGDRILAVNGIPISDMRHEEVVRLVKESSYTVTLTVGVPDMFSSSSSAVTLRSASVPPGYQSDSDGSRLTTADTSPYRQPLPQQHLQVKGSVAMFEETHPCRWEKMAPMEASHAYYSVDLQRGSRGFGFSIRGGREFNNMPLFILKIAEGGAAHLEGTLQVGDELIEIDGHDTTGMTHAQAIDLIESRASNMKIVVRRAPSSHHTVTLPQASVSSGQRSAAGMRPVNDAGMSWRSPQSAAIGQMSRPIRDEHALRTNQQQHQYSSAYR